MNNEDLQTIDVSHSNALFKVVKEVLTKSFNFDYSNRVIRPPLRTNLTIQNMISIFNIIYNQRNTTEYNMIANPRGLRNRYQRQIRRDQITYLSNTIVRIINEGNTRGR